MIKFQLVNMRCYSNMSDFGFYLTGEIELQAVLACWVKSLIELCIRCDEPVVIIIEVSSSRVVLINGGRLIFSSRGQCIKRVVLW